jgi:uncharacterized protein (DUF362 family)
MVLPVVAIVHCPSGVDHDDGLVEVLDKARFWDALDQASAGRSRDSFRILIKPDLNGFEAGSAQATSPALVEALVDLLNDRGFHSVALGSAPDGAAAWAANRDVFALFDLMGYKFVTSKGRNYEVADLSEGLVEDVFSRSSSLRDSKLASAWLNADFRIVFSKCRTDETEGYSLGLRGIVDVLPETDKDLHYKRARNLGEVVSDVLALRPVDFALIDALVSCHGGGGRRSPRLIETQTLVASSNVVLADYVCALKMGLDPYVSRVLRSVTEAFPLPRYVLEGDVSPFANWENTTPVVLGSRRYREGADYLDRLLEPWLQSLDPELFSLKRPLDATLNRALAGFFDGSKQSPTADFLLLAINLLAGSVGHAVESYRTLFDKDALRQRTVNLGFDPGKYEDRVFDQIVDDLEALVPLAIQAPERAPGLRWRTIDQATVFSFERTVDVDFDLFTRKVPVANVIQFMNDYIGGAVVVLETDDQNRPTKQAERNLYLPQPNYLSLFHGKMIDVAKLECARYSRDQCALFWKTVESKNGSAVYDDGKASFTRTAEGNTAVSIIGRQRFELPLFWQVFDLDYVPELKTPLVTDAYQTFFNRTVSNFEALVEGRDIRIGYPLEQSASSESDQLMALLDRISRLAAPLLSRLAGPKELALDGQKDSDGFVHGVASSYVAKGGKEISADDAPLALVGFIDGLKRAMARDFAGTLKSR